jgi:hypothetical protein
MKIAGLILAAASLGAGPAWSADACLRPKNVFNWKVIDEQNLQITDNAQTVFDVKLLGRCSGLQSTQVLSVRAMGGATCVTAGDRISFPQGGAGEQSCGITSITAVPKDTSNK